MTACIRPAWGRAGPVCFYCGEEGIHRTLDQCIAMLRVQIALLLDARRRMPPEDGAAAATGAAAKTP